MNNRPAPTARRRRHFIDTDLQGRLALALVALEVGLFAGACGYLYYALATIIEDQLYIVHAAQREPLLPLMLVELLKVVAVCAAVNSAALFATHRLWGRHVTGVLDTLGGRIARIGAIDLRPHGGPGEARAAHRLIALCDRWIAAEQARLTRVDAALARLPAAIGEDREVARAAIDEALRQLRRG